MKFNHMLPLYVGSYTRSAFSPDSDGKNGLSLFLFDQEQGDLTFQDVLADVENPSYFNFDRTGEVLYTVSEKLGGVEGEVIAFRVDRTSRSLKLLNRRLSGGAAPCYISMTADNQYLFAANYMTGSLSLFHRKEDGGLSQMIDKIQHRGSGLNPERQAGPHVHCVLPDPAGLFIYAADLGADCITRYRLELSSGRLILCDTTAMVSGSGPRHLVFHRSGRFLFVTGEMGNTVSVLKLEADLPPVLLESYSTLPDQFNGSSHCSDLHLSASGDFLYVGNRGHDSIAVFRVNQTSGELFLLGHEKSRGRNPRNFVLDPSGRYLLAANQDSNNIAVFAVDEKTGMLFFTGEEVSIPAPVCLKFKPASDNP